MKRHGKRLTAGLMAVCLAASPALADPAVHEVSQHGKAFHPDHLKIAVGDRLVLHNDDKRTHNIRVFHPKLEFDSGEQEPGEDVRITFDQPGTYYVTCGIHTQMELKVEVAAAE
jgi:cytochrome c peroxidase